MTPRSLVGIIIGKNGDMIKKITGETSCRIQFKPGMFLCLSLSIKFVVLYNILQNCFVTGVVFCCCEH